MDVTAEGVPARKFLPPAPRSTPHFHLTNRPQLSHMRVISFVARFHSSPLLFFIFYSQCHFISAVPKEWLWTGHNRNQLIVEAQIVCFFYVFFFSPSAAAHHEDVGVEDVNVCAGSRLHAACVTGAGKRSSSGEKWAQVGSDLRINWTFFSD